MYQNRYESQVLKELIKEQAHVRKISKSLNISPMAVTRALKELQIKGLIEHKKEGKNKVCSLKSHPSLLYYFKSGNSAHLAEIIREYPHIHSIIEKIKEDDSISIAILHGSYASKTAFEQTKPEVMIELQKSVKMPKLEAHLGKITLGRIKELKEYAIIKGEQIFVEKLLSNSFAKD